jgi:VWFA-related protein
VPSSLYSQKAPEAASQTAQAAQKPDISVDVKLVNVLATVRDKKGAIVRNLTKDDFILEEDGRPQTIQFFSQETDLPLTLGLLVDTSMSQRDVLTQERNASYSFIDHMLRDKDKAFVIHFDQEVELLQDLTPSREKLSAALELLDTPRRDNGGYGGGGRNNGGNGGPGGGGRGRRGGFGAGTLLYDAIYLASNEVLKPVQGRKAIVVLTDGVDHGSRESLDSAIESAQRADTLVFSILFAGQEPGGRRGGFGGPGMGASWPGGRGGGWPGGGRRTREERPDGKKFCSAFHRKPAVRFTKSLRRNRSRKSTRALRKACVMNTSSATRPTSPNSATTRFISPRRTRIYSSKRATATMRSSWRPIQLTT